VRWRAYGAVFGFGTAGLQRPAGPNWSRAVRPALKIKALAKASDQIGPSLLRDLSTRGWPRGAAEAETARQRAKRSSRFLDYTKSGQPCPGLPPLGRGTVSIM
jgi:hypothetical protein